jgi:hypothetical protein
VTDDDPPLSASEHLARQKRLLEEFEAEAERRRKAAGLDKLEEQNKLWRDALRVDPSNLVTATAMESDPALAAAKAMEVTKGTWSNLATVLKSFPKPVEFLAPVVPTVSASIDPDFLRSVAQAGEQQQAIDQSVTDAIVARTQTEDQAEADRLDRELEHLQVAKLQAETTAALHESFQLEATKQTQRDEKSVGMMEQLVDLTKANVEGANTMLWVAKVSLCVAALAFVATIAGVVVAIIALHHSNGDAQDVGAAVVKALSKAK